MSIHSRRGWAGVRPDEEEPESPAEVFHEQMVIDRNERASTRISFLPWALRIPERKTGTLDFETFPYQRELYGDDVVYAPDTAVKKATQVGESTRLIRWAMFFADTRGWTGLYVFPKLKQLYEFSDQRIKPLVENNDYLRSRVPRGYVNNKGLKQIGHGFVNFRGSQNKEELDAVDADHLALDEYDSIVQENIPDAEQRVTGSPHGLIARCGVPSVPGYGITKLYAQSDRRSWHVRCEACGEWQPLDYWKNVDQERVLVVCHRDACRKPLDVRKGEWVAERLDGDLPRGYHMSRLMVPTNRLRLLRMIERSRATKAYEVETFWNKNLGLEYTSEESGLTLEAIEAAMSRGGHRMVQGYRGTNPVTLGVDVASVRACNLRVSEHISPEEKRALWIGTVDGRNLNELLVALDDVMRNFGVHMAAIDAAPEYRLAQAFASRWPGRVYLTRLSGTQLQPFVVKEEIREIVVNRTIAFDAMIAMIRSQKNLLPINPPDDYRDHLIAPRRFYEEDDKGKVTVGYRSMGADDFALGEVFDMIATEAWWLRQAVDTHFKERYSTIDEHVDFDRSTLDTYDDVSYQPGPELPGDDDEGWTTGEEDWPRIG